MDTGVESSTGIYILYTGSVTRSQSVNTVGSATSSEVAFTYVNNALLYYYTYIVYMYMYVYI